MLRSDGMYLQLSLTRVQNLLISLSRTNRDRRKNEIMRDTWPFKSSKRDEDLGVAKRSDVDEDRNRNDCIKFDIMSFSCSQEEILRIVIDFTLEK